MATLAPSIGAIADSLARAVCWSAVLDMALQGQLPARGLVRMLTASMGGETSASVLQSLLDRTRQLMTQMPDPAWLAECQNELARAAGRLLRAAKPGSDRQLAWAQLLSWTAVTPQQLDTLAGLLGSSAAIDGLTVLFPYTAASPALLAQIDAFLAAQRREPGLARVVIEGRDVVTKTLRARALPSG
jgi:aminopeptidase N